MCALRTVWYGSCGPFVANPTLMVECKEDLNASRALLVLEHNIKKECVCVCVAGLHPPVWSPGLEGQEKGCKSADEAQLVLEHEKDRV